MSRHTLPAHTRKHEVVIGYDAPMDGFFCQVFDRDVRAANNALEEELAFTHDADIRHILMKGGFEDDCLHDIGFAKPVDLETAVSFAKCFAIVPTAVISALQDEKAGLQATNRSVNWDDLEEVLG